jgi:hypothetical protein
LSATIEGPLAQSWETDLRQMLGALGLIERVKIEQGIPQGTIRIELGAGCPPVA